MDELQAEPARLAGQTWTGSVSPYTEITAPGSGV